MPDQNEEDISRVGGSHGNEAESGHLGSTGSNKFWFLKKKKKKKKKKKNNGRDDDDNHEEERYRGHIDNKQKVSKANEMVPFPLKKDKQRLSFPTKSPSTSISSASFPGQFGSCSCFCFKHPRMMSESSVPSPKSDPNSPSFTLSMLTSLIENNDFYSRECNPHLVHNG